MGVLTTAVRRSIDEAKKGSAEVVNLAVVEHEGHHGCEIAKLIGAAFCSWQPGWRASLSRAGRRALPPSKGLKGD